MKKKVRSADHGGAFSGQKRQSVGPRMRGSKRRGCLPCDGAPALSNHPPQYVLNGSQSPVREGGQRGLACPLGGHLRGRRTGARTQGGGRGCQAGVGGASESDGGGKGGIQPLRIGILGTQDIRLSSAQQWPVRRWQGPLGGPLRGAAEGPEGGSRTVPRLSLAPHPPTASSCGCCIQDGRKEETQTQPLGTRGVASFSYRWKQTFMGKGGHKVTP